MNEKYFKSERVEFGKHVRALRKRIQSTDYNRDKISLQELTDQSSGITKKTLGKIERGETNPKFETLLILAEMLQVSLPELLDYKNRF